MVCVCIFPNKTTTTPCINQLQKWRTVRRNLMRRTVRAEKNGPMIGGYILTGGGRCDENVKTRGFIQLDIDTKIDKATGEILKSAPPFADICPLIAKFEYVAASSHGHDPARGIVKYRITFLLDRVIKEEEYDPLLETLDDWLGSCLDRDAWIWSQAFYLPSCPPDRVGDAFAIHNMGALLPVDIAVEYGRQIIAARQSIAGPSTGSGRAGQTGATSSVASGPRPAPEPETPKNIARIQSMLDAIDPDIDREPWLKACWATLATGWSCAEELIRKWSERGKKFVEADFAKVVASFDPARTHGIGVGTLVHIAREHGWQDPRQAPGGGLRDIANGQRFAKTFRNKLLWIADLGDWLEFDPQIGWRPAPSGAADRAAMDIVKEMQAEIKTDKQMTEVSRTSQLRNLRAMIEIAKSMPGMFANLSEFDTDPMLIGLQNGIFNLDRWELEPPTPERKVLMRANVAYDPDADCPGFRKFLKRIQPDREIRAFLRVWHGYGLTGLTREHVFVYYYGDGNNGKGTFIESIAWVFGDYARKIPTEMLMTQQRNSQGPSPDIMLLKGARFVWANETEEGKRIDEARVKDMTGGDTLTGRVPHAKAFVQFQPTPKLNISGNYKAEIRDNSHGMWRRMVLVLFDVTIPKADLNLSLGDTLKAEASGIFNWCLQGLRDYKTNGLTVPKAIQAATAAYREEQDLIGEWLRDNCVSREEMEATLGAHWLAAELVRIAKREGKPEAKLEEGKRILYGNYDNWAKAANYKPVSQKRLTGQLRKRGYPLAPSQREISGITLKNSRIGQAYSSAMEAAARAKAAEARLAALAASGNGPVASIPDVEDRKIVKFKKHQATPEAPVPDRVPDPGAAGADGIGTAGSVVAPDEFDVW
jgi:putative DNA primase/helicase